MMINPATCIACGSHNFKSHITVGDSLILKCKNCKLGITHPAPVLPDYANMDFHSNGKENVIDKFIKAEDLPLDWQKSLKIQIEIIKDNFSIRSKILEIGCGEGLLLSMLKDEGYMSISGVEPSYSAAKRSSARGIPTINKLFDTIDFKEKYDLIILSHVFEHIPDPIQFLNKTKLILSDKGGILFSQTNYKGLIPTVLGSNWYAWVPEQHYWHFTLNSLNLILKQKGFILKDYKYCSLVHPFNNLYKFTYQIAKLFPSCQDQFISLYKLESNILN